MTWLDFSIKIDYYFALFPPTALNSRVFSGKITKISKFPKSKIFGSWRAILFCAIEFTTFWICSLATEMMLYKKKFNLDFFSLKSVVLSSSQRIYFCNFCIELIVWFAKLTYKLLFRKNKVHKIPMGLNFDNYASLFQYT